MTPTSGGYGGGVPVTITGRGFAPLSTGATSVTVCGLPCAVTAANYTSLTCLTPGLATPASLAAFAHVAPSVLNGTAVGIGATSAAYRLATDGNIETTMKATACATGTCCSVGLDLTSAAVARVTKVRVYPNFRRTSALSGASFQGSADGVSYTTLATVTGRVQESWTEIDVTNTRNFRFLRFVGPASGLCEVGGPRLGSRPLLCLGLCTGG
jgi:hypothetical protein